jgi:hypothetical protein
MLTLGGDTSTSQGTQYTGESTEEQRSIPAYEVVLPVRPENGSQVFGAAVDPRPDDDVESDDSRVRVKKPVKGGMSRIEPHLADCLKSRCGKRPQSLHLCEGQCGLRKPAPMFAKNPYADVSTYLFFAEVDPPIDVVDGMSLCGYMIK